MKRREPPLTSSGVRRRARIALEKRLRDIAEDSLLESEQTNKADTHPTTRQTDKMFLSLPLKQSLSLLISQSALLQA